MAALAHSGRTNHDPAAIDAAAAETVAVKAAAATAGNLLNDIAACGRNGRGRHGIGSAKAGDGGSKQYGSEQFFHGRIPLFMSRPSSDISKLVLRNGKSKERI
jgi:hypothetical protein